VSVRDLPTEAASRIPYHDVERDGTGMTSASMIASASESPTPGAVPCSGPAGGDAPQCHGNVTRLPPPGVIVRAMETIVVPMFVLVMIGVLVLCDAVPDA
jgi:hypothetical protein